MTIHAIIYDRASTELQKDNYSRVNAREVGIRIAEQNGYTWEYVKEIGSGTTLTGRPKMMKILDRIAASEVQRVIVQELDRLARPIDRAVYETIRNIFIEYDVIVHTHSGTYDFANDDSDFVADINMAVSKKEALRIKKRMRRGMVARAEAGKPIGEVATGYKLEFLTENGASVFKNGRPVRKMVIDDDGAKLIQLIFDKLQETNGNIGRTAIELNEAGYRTPSGKMFRPYSINLIANRKIYIGIMESSLTDKVIYRPELQIIPVEQFDRVQAMIKNRKRDTPGVKGEYPFTGFVVCENCGGPMVGSNYKTGLRYTCLNRRYGKKVCTHGKTYRHSSLVEATAALIVETIQNSGILERILTDAANEYGKTISEEAHEAQIDGHLKVVAESRQRLIDAVAEGAFTIAQITPTLDELKAKEQRLIVERASIGKKAAVRDDFIWAIEALSSDDLQTTLIALADEKPAAFRRILGMFFEPNSLRVKQTRTSLTIEDFQFTTAFLEFSQKLSFCISNQALI